MGFERHALEREPVRRHFEAASWFLPSRGAFCRVDGPVSASPERVRCPRHPRHRQGARLTAQAGPAVGGAGSLAGPGHGPWQGSLSRGARGAVGPVTLASSKNCESRPAVGAGFRAPVKRPVEYGAPSRTRRHTPQLGRHRGARGPSVLGALTRRPDVRGLERDGHVCRDRAFESGGR